MSSLFSQIGTGDWKKAKKAAKDGRKGDFFRPDPGNYVCLFQDWVVDKTDSGSVYCRIDWEIVAGSDKGQKISQFQNLIGKNGKVNTVGLQILQTTLSKLQLPEPQSPGELGDILDLLRDTVPKVRLKVKKNKKNADYDDINLARVIEPSTTGVVPVVDEDEDEDESEESDVDSDEDSDMDSDEDSD